MNHREYKEKLLKDNNFGDLRWLTYQYRSGERVKPSLLIASGVVFQRTDMDFYDNLLSRIGKYINETYDNREYYLPNPSISISGGRTESDYIITQKVQKIPWFYVGTYFETYDFLNVFKAELTSEEGREIRLQTEIEFPLPQIKTQSDLERVKQEVAKYHAQYLGIKHIKRKKNFRKGLENISTDHKLYWMYNKTAKTGFKPQPQQEPSQKTSNRQQSNIIRLHSSNKEAPISHELNTQHSARKLVRVK